MKITRGRAGFTLVEMMVTIGIISLLLTTVIIGASSIRLRSRDAERKADLHKVLSGLAMFYADRKIYPLPVTAAPGYFNGSVGGYSQMVGNGTTAGLVKDGYLDSAYQDPINDGAQGYKYRYRVSSDGLQSEVSAKLENSNDGDLTNDNPAGDAGRYEVGSDKVLDTSTATYNWVYDFNSSLTCNSCKME